MNSSLLTDLFTDTSFLGIPVLSWLFALCVAALSFVVLRTGVSFLRRRFVAAASRSDSLFSAVAALVVGGTSNVLIGLAALLIGAGVLDLPTRWADRVSR